MLRTLLVGIATFIFLLGCEPETPAVEFAKDQDISKADTTEQVTEKVNRDLFGLRIDSLEVSDHEVKRNESLYLILQKLNFSAQEIYNITQKARDIVDLSNIKPGQRYRTYASADSGAGLTKMVWQPNDLEYVVFDWKDSLEVYRAARPLSQKKAVASGEVSNSLYQTVSEKGASPVLAYKLAEVFAWQIDFFGLREGDSFNVLYNKQYIGDEFLATGDILAASFVHRGEEYRAYKFTKGSIDGYYTEEGESVEKALLKAPFKFNQRISSHFSHSRYHPILKKRMPHYGVDYAAPHGTPILSVGDGTVTEARYRGANGNIVKINHNTSYRTAYLHLSKFASGIRPGAKVKQGQIIGYVGSTGRSTGPHLDYRLYKNDRPVNPLTVDLPSSESVPDSLMEEFQEVRDSLDHQLTSQVDTENKEKANEIVTQAGSQAAGSVSMNPPAEK